MNSFLSLLQWAFLAWRGRVVAVFFLFGVALASVVSEMELPQGLQGSTTALVRAILGSPFAAARQSLFDSYQHVVLRERQSQPVTIVEIDESSLKLVGQWPWPRDRLALLIDKVAAHKPLAIGLDLYMPEVDETNPARIAANLPAGNERLAQALTRLPSHESRLIQSLQAAPTVLGAAGFHQETPTTSRGLRATPVKVIRGDVLSHVVHYPWVLASLPELQAAARGQAMLSVDAGQTIIRRIPLIMGVNGQVMPSMALEMIRIATGDEVVEAVADSHGLRQLTVADLTIPTQTTGEIWLHFALRNERDSSRQVSAAAVFEGRASADAFTNKLVLVGLTGSGLNDKRNTPLGQLVPGIEIQAQLIETFLEGRFLQRPWWMKGAEVCLLLMMGLLMVWLIPQSRSPASEHSSKKLPKASAWLLLGGCATLFAAGFVLFAWFGWLFDASMVVIGYAAVMVSLVSSSMLETERDNILLAVTQQRLREEAVRVAGELAVARSIQLGSLPDAAQAFPDERRFEFATLLEPAREVGGDLYDFFMIDDRRLCFVVADVSGKGVPASVFMAVTKALAKSFSMRLPGGPAEVVIAANHDLSRENVGMLFVTLLLGVLDVESGVLEMVNAGHDSPWRITVGGLVEKIDTPAQAGGPPLCVLDEFTYKSQTIQLNAGDTLCLITDGVTEAMNEAGELFGGQRLCSTLATLPSNQSLQQGLDQVRAEIAAFVGRAEPSDDLTLMLLRWNPTGTNGLTSD